MEINDYIDANLVHSIHVSERRSFRGCRRRWSWIFRDMWYPQTTAKPLEFGIAYHKAAEYWYDPDFWGNDRDVRMIETLHVFKVECNNQLAEYKQGVRDGKIQQFQSDEEVEADYKERIELGQGMLREMFKQSAELDHDTYTPVGVEVKFEVPILRESQIGVEVYNADKQRWDTKMVDAPPSDTSYIWCKCDRCWKKYKAYYMQEYGGQREQYQWDALKEGWRGLPVTFGGRIDMLAQDIYGRYWIFDWKTAARLSTGEPNAPDDYLWFDDQITGYCWALWTLGIDVAGFVYHEQKKAMAEEPEPLKRPYKGALYSQNKQNTYDYEVYKRTVEENDPQGFAAGLYDDYIQHLKDNNIFYKRHTITRNEHELQAAGIAISYEAEEITNPKLRIYKSAGRFSCGYCAFKEPCLAIDRGEDYMYTLESLFDKREKLYYETAESNTDKPMKG